MAPLAGNLGECGHLEQDALEQGERDADIHRRRSSCYFPPGAVQVEHGGKIVNSNEGR